MKLSINLPELKYHSKRSSVGPPSKRVNHREMTENNSTARVSKILFSSQGPRPILLNSTVCVGDEAKLEFFDTYLNLPLISERNRHEHVEDNPNVAYLGEIEKMHIRPQPFGIVRRKGPNTFIDIHMYSMGDTFAGAFSKGVSQYKEVTNLNLKANRLTDSGCAKILSEIFSKKIKTITLSENKLGIKSIEKIIKIVSIHETRLRTLEIESIFISERALADLCRALADNKTLHNLNLAKNNLGLIACGALKELLRYNSTLRKLDLHWNNIRSEGAIEFFDGLSQNDCLSVLDLSWNSIGRDSTYESVKALGKCLELNSTVLHLDLSFNFFTFAECETLAELIKDNHNCIGLHMTGNECYVDPQGFIIPHLSSQSSAQEGHFFNRILNKSKYSKHHQQSNNCWICEKWVEMTFEWKPEQIKDPNYIHLSIDKFLPTPLSKQLNISENLSVTRVLPPGNAKFYFSNQISAFTSKSYSTTSLEKSISANGPIKEISKVNITPTTGEVCNLKDLFASKARMNFEDLNKSGPEYEKIPWSLPLSIFQNYVPRTEELITECFEFDWGSSKLSGFIKDNEARDQVKLILREKYEPILEAYKTISALSGSEVFAIGTNIFNDFLNQCRIFDNLYSNSDLGVNWNITNAAKDKTQVNNSGNGLCRYEFLEIITRIAHDRFVRSKVCQSTTEAVAKLYSDHLDPILAKYETETWRSQVYMTEEIDYLLRAHKNLFEHVYKKYSGKDAVPGQKMSMSLSEFRSLCNESKIVNEDFTSREIDMCFSRAVATQTDYLNNSRHLEMNFTEFLEAISRAANELKGDGLKAKIESIVPKILSICSQNFINSFQYPTEETYFHLMYRVKTNVSP